MRIKSIHLSDYKRFTDLSITGIPETARLVVLVGPNGSGKSSVFDSFLLKAKATVSNIHLSGNFEQYYEKVVPARNTQAVANRVTIEFYNEQVNFKTAFQIRSAYRNEADFQVQTLEAKSQRDEVSHIARIIDVDRSVSRNYIYLVWKELRDLHHDSNADITFKEYIRQFLGDLQSAMRGLFSDPELMLQDFGGAEGGSFRFAKGSVKDFHYKNLSSGEKAAFDVLLDVFVKSRKVKDAVFCIDEPELHVATGLQGALIAAVLKLLPESAQLWVATHSIGVVREAYRMGQTQPGSVAFLDFSKKDFDNKAFIEPSTPNRAFWRNIYGVTLDDLAALVAPQRVVICEGSQNRADGAFDAKCYNKLFTNEYPETLFISRGGSGEVIKSEHLMTILSAVAAGIEVVRLIDRDNMADEEREIRIQDGIRVLCRREIEEYLYDRKVLRTFLESQDQSEDVVDKVLEKQVALLTQNPGPPNIKDSSQGLFEFIRRTTKIPNLGSSREAFAVEFLVPALSGTPSVLEELREDIFG